MTIVFNCGDCGSRIQAPDNLTGQKARCPTCQAVVTVPENALEAEEVPPRTAQSRPDDFDAGSPAAQHEAGGGRASEGDEWEDRRPCPMCGEMILTRAVKCRFCGEVFDPVIRRSHGRDPGIERKFNQQMNALGGLWIFLGGLAILGIAVIASRLPRGSEVLLVVVVLIALCWVVFGLFTCLKQIWAVYAGLVLSYISLLGNIVNFAQVAGAQGGPELCGPVIALVILIVGIVQGHRCVSMYGQLSRGYGD
jgi:hypothetical protein